MSVVSFKLEAGASGFFFFFSGTGKPTVWLQSYSVPEIAGLYLFLMKSLANAIERDVIKWR
jgi:uncharacterized protein (AIM24 family)